MKVDVVGFVSSRGLMDLANGKGRKCFFEEVYRDGRGEERRQQFTVKIWETSPAFDRVGLFDTRGAHLRIRGRVVFRRYKSTKYQTWMDDVSVEVDEVEELEYRRERDGTRQYEVGDDGL